MIPQSGQVFGDNTMKLAIVFVSMCIGIAAAHAQTDSQDYDFWIYEGCAPPGPILEGTLNGTQYFFGRDTAGNTRFLASAGGLAVERVEYGDFGMPILLDGNGQPLQGSGSGKWATSAMRIPRRQIIRGVLVRWQNQ
jgi:hypothetical protein